MARLTGPTLACILALAAILACSNPQPRPKGAAATPALPTPNLGTVQDDEEADLANAFEAEVRQVADQATFLAAAPCDRLVSATDQDPSLVATLRGLAVTLKGLATREEALDRPSTQALLQEMDQALAGLDQALQSCKLDPRPSEARAAPSVSILP